MDLRILGPLEAVVHGRPVHLGGRRQRALLALLLLNANEVISSDRLIDELWGDRAPGGARKALQMQVARLRRALEPAGGVGGRRALVTRPPGYSIELADDELDLRRFERLRSRASEALRSGDAAAAFELLSEALGQWRGPPLGDLSYEPCLQHEIARLEELRLSALEDRVAAQLELGRHADLVGELETLVTRHPLRERLRRHQMLVLYRCGRQAEALAAYREARRALVAELGIEPTRELQELERAILVHDRELDLPAPPQLAARADQSPERGTPTPVVEETGSGPPFVGRERELGELGAGLERALGGRGTLFLLSGEPGIGKTRLAHELAGRATQRGLTVLWGRCWEAGGAPAYWPWVQAIRGYLRETDAALVRSQLGTGAVDVAEIVPDVRGLVPDLPEPASNEGAGARFRLFDAAVSFLKSAAEARPLLLVLDDLHAADQPSLLLLRFLAGELGAARIVGVGTFRDLELGPDHPLRSTLAELFREQTVHPLELSGLGPSEVGRLIELSTGVGAPAKLVTALHRQTEGNPLFVGEVARLLASEGLLEAGDGGPRWRVAAIPEGVRETIGRRVRRLSPRCREVLVHASVLGREFALAPLERVSRCAREELLELLGEAVASGLIAEAAVAHGRFRFSHGLVGESLYDELTPARRVALHRLAGDALEELHGRDLEPHLAELAHHFFQASPGRHDGKALDYARRAGDRAAARSAYEEAARLYEMALETTEPRDEAARCELLLRLGDVQSMAGEMGEARKTFLEAAASARRTGTPDRFARAALGYGGRLVWARAAGDRRLLDLLREALAALGDGDSVLRARLLARLSGALRDDRSVGPRDRLSREAVEVARRVGDPATLSWALDGRHLAIWSPDTPHERIAIADEMLALADESGKREAELLAHDYRLYALLELGDLPRVETELEQTVRLARALKQPTYWWKVWAVQALLALLQGRLGEAEVFSERARESGGRSLIVAAIPTHELQTYALRREQGRLETVDQTVRRAAAESPEYPLWRCVAVELHFELGREAEARASLEELATSGFSALHRDEEWLLGLTLLAPVCAALGDASRAQLLYDLLRPYAERIAFGAPEFATGSVSHSLGLLASALSHWDEAEAHFTAGLATNERMKALPWAARTRQDLARMLIKRDEPGDRERVLDLLDQSGSTYAALGMRSWAQRTRALRESLAGARAG
jgi:DNA-binding SARP family transcriptional activator